MSIVSYAQNYEDVMLWRALKHIKRGFYIDVGAHSPDDDSVTKLFYENNWKGINIEPSREFFVKLKEKRPNDVNLCIALGDEHGKLEMNVFSNPGLSTLDDSVAQQHIESGLNMYKQTVDIETLATVCSNQIKKNQEVHFLKIDVEGFETEVLRGNDWKTYRPWIVVVEATLPMSQEESFCDSESIILSASYQFAYADGLNRFYVANEHLELLPAFKYPPNIFDEFTLSSQRKVEQRAEHAKQKAKKANEQTRLTLMKLQEMHDSRSWAITAPLRWLGYQWGLVRQLGFLPRIVALFKKAARGLLKMSVTCIGYLPSYIRSRLTSVAIWLGLDKKLRSSLLFDLENSEEELNAVDRAAFLKPTNTEQLTLHGKHVFSGLENAMIEHHKGKN